MPESCSDLGAEGQVTEEMLLAARAHGKFRASIAAAIAASPLNRRVEELEAGLTEVLASIANSRRSTIGRSQVYSPQIDARALGRWRALLKDGER